MHALRKQPRNYLYCCSTHTTCCCSHHFQQSGAFGRVGQLGREKATPGIDHLNAGLFLGLLRGYAIPSGMAVLLDTVKTR